MCVQNRLKKSRVDENDSPEKNEKETGKNNEFPLDSRRFFREVAGPTESAFPSQ